MKKIFAVILTLTAIFSLCAYQVEALEPDYSFEKYFDTWDEYLEFRASDDFVDTTPQRFFWEIKDVLDGIISYEKFSGYPSHIHLLENWDFDLNATKEPAYPLYSVFIEHSLHGGIKPYYPNLENYPVLNSINEEEAIAMGHADARLMLDGRELSVIVKDGNILVARFVIANGTYKASITFNEEYVPEDDGKKILGVEPPVTLEQRLSFISAIADMMEEEAKNVEPAPSKDGGSIPIINNNDADDDEKDKNTGSGALKNNWLYFGAGALIVVIAAVSVFAAVKRKKAKR